MVSKIIWLGHVQMSNHKFIKFKNLVNNYHNTWNKNERQKITVLSLKTNLKYITRT